MKRFNHKECFYRHAYFSCLYLGWVQGINIYRLYSYFTAIVALKHGHWLRHGVAGVAHSCSLKHFLVKVVLTKQSKMVIGRHRMDTEWYNTLQIKKFPNWLHYLPSLYYAMCAYTCLAFIQLNFQNSLSYLIGLTWKVCSRLDATKQYFLSNFRC